MTRKFFQFHFGGSALFLGRETKLMGVLNVTPDSFSDGGFFLDPGKAAARALQMEREGAHLLDIGGESSRPGSKPVSAREEIRRIRPVLKRIAKSIKIPISVDTYKLDVACMALDEGARVINDIYALRGNKLLAKQVARRKAGIVLMHMQGRPETMQKKPVYKNCVREVFLALKKSAAFALEAGITPSQIVLDPGFGFGKTAEQNMEMLRNFDKFSGLSFPLLAGFSRKSFLAHWTGTAAGASDRLYASLAAGAAAIARGVHILRVHDVPAHRQMAAVIDRVSGHD